MSPEIPMFSARGINRVEDYTRFFHVKSYLKQRSDLFRGPEADRRLMAACGYRNKTRFLRRRPEWDALARPVPLPYLAAIRADLDVLTVAAEADLEEYRAALTLPLFPRYGIERAMPAIYLSLRFPPGTAEADAISLLLTRSRQTGHECCVSIPGLKSVFTHPDGAIRTIYFEPRLRVEGGFLVARGDGRLIGTCRVGR